MRRIVSDTGPLLHLTEADALHLLRYVGTVSIPPQVLAEMRRHVRDWHLPAWIVVEPLDRIEKAQARTWQDVGILDAGEAEAIVLAQRLHADWFLTDDTAARVLARDLGLEVHGSLGVVLWAAATSHLDESEAGATLSRLATSSLWMSDRVLAEARTALRKLFEP